MERNQISVRVELPEDQGGGSVDLGVGYDVGNEIKTLSLVNWIFEDEETRKEVLVKYANMMIEHRPGVYDEISNEEEN